MEGSNPLRPYYVPPTIGTPQLQSRNARKNASTPASSGLSKSSLGSSARDILSDLDYNDYLSDSSPSATEVIKNLLDQGLWRYSSVLLAQPFEVAKTVLQVQLHDPSRQKVLIRKARGSASSRTAHEATYDVTSEDSDPDSPSYFTSSAPVSRPSRPRTRRFSSPSASDSPQEPSRASARPTKVSHRISPTLRLTQVLSSLWATEGAWGVWKGANSTFIHSVLTSTVTSFIRSILCAALAIPDPGFGPNASPPYLINMPSAVGGLDVLSSPYPMTSLLTAVGAAGITGILLAPIDIARTVLMLTPSTHPPRSLLTILQSMDSWSVPFWLAPVTFLHSTLPTAISASTPLILRSRLGIDPILTPNMYAVASFVSQVFELGIRLPIETVLRRGQVLLSNTERPSQTLKARKIETNSTSSTDLPTVVEVGEYKGLVGTMYHIIFEEGGRSENEPGSAGKMVVLGRAARFRKGQGLEGLYRGWRLGIWGLVGVWGAAALGGAGKGGEF